MLKKEIISIGLLDKTLLHPREIFHPAIELNAASVILIHNHPSGDASPSKKDSQVVERITHAGKIMGIPVIDFLILSENGYFSFHEKLKDKNTCSDYILEGNQKTLFDLLELDKPTYEATSRKIKRHYFQPQKSKSGYFQLQNRRYLGNKYKLLGLFEDIIFENVVR